MVTKIKKAIIYFDDGDYSDGNSLNGFIKGDGDGIGKAVTHKIPRYKHG
jgi:hypothetical protein